MFNRGLPKDVVEYLKKNCEYSDEEIKANEVWLKDKIEYIRKYGMCPIHIQFIKEYDKLMKIRKEPPKLLGENEPDWKFGFFLAMTKKYGGRAGWTFQMAFREFLQNALDGAEEVGGSVSDVKIETDGDSIIIENPSKKLLIKHLEIGGSEKPCWSRGRYGEGLDIASSWIVDTGGIVYIMSHDVAYKIVGAEGRLLVLVADIPHIGNRTIVRIFHPDASRMQDLVDKLLPNKSLAVYTVNIKDWECDKPMPNTILKRSEGRGKIYHRDMFVNYTDIAYGKDSLYDYDLWWFDVSRDRVNLNNVYKFKGNVTSVYDHALRNLYSELEKRGWKYLDKKIENTKEYQLIKGILDKCLFAHYDKNGVFFILEGGYLEFDAIANLTTAPKQVFTYILKNEIVKIVGVDKADKIGFVVGVSAPRIRDYLYRGYVPVLIRKVDPTIANWNSIDVLMTENDRKEVDNVKKIALPMIKYPDTIEDIFLGYGPEVVYLANSAFNYTVVVSYAITNYSIKDFISKKSFFAEFDKAKIDKDTIAFYSHQDDAIYVGIDRLLSYAEDSVTSEIMFDLVFEEITHMTSGASDNTALFEKALISNARKFAQELSKAYTRVLYSMAHNGLFIDAHRQIRGMERLMTEVNMGFRLPSEIRKKIVEWRTSAEDRWNYIYSVSVDTDLEYYVDVTKTLPRNIDEFAGMIAVENALSPIVVFALTVSPLGQKGFTVIFIRQYGYAKDKLSEGYFGYIATGRYEYFKLIFDRIIEIVPKHFELLDDPYIGIIKLDRVELFDGKGKKVWEVEY